MICSGCGKEIADSAKFCKYCGAKIEPPKPKKRFCTECGKELSENAKFCKSCGARVGAAPADKTDTSAGDIPVLTIPVKGPVLSVEITDEIPAPAKTTTQTQTAARAQTVPTAQAQSERTVQAQTKRSAQAQTAPTTGTQAKPTAPDAPKPVLPVPPTPQAARRCPKCGTPLAESARFCSQCKTALPAPEKTAGASAASVQKNGNGKKTEKKSTKSTEAASAKAKRAAEEALKAIIARLTDSDVNASGASGEMDLPVTDAQKAFLRMLSRGL